MIKVTSRVKAPISRVFQMMTDLESAPDRIPGIIRMEVLTDGPVGVGTRFRETRIMFKRETSEVMEIVEFIPDQSYTVTAESCGCLYTTTFRFERADGVSENETDVTFEMTSKPLTFMARIMSIAFFFMKGMMKKLVQQDLDAIKAAAEAE